MVKEGLYPFLKKIMVLNKLDLNSKRQVNFLEMTDFLNNELDLDNIEVSLRTQENVDILIKKIYNAINIKNQIPINIIYEADKLAYKNKDIPQITIILIGDSAVGKSCFLSRYFNNTFNEEFLTTIGIDKQVKIIKIDETEYKLNFWDTAGQERFRSLPKKYYQNADGIFIFYDVTNQESFKNINYWLENIQNCVGNDEIKSSMFLIGNKIDLNNRVISRNDAENFAHNIGMKYYETSGKINLNVNEVIGRMILECHMNISKTNDCFVKSKRCSSSTQINTEVKEGERGCCGGGNNNNKKKKERKNSKHKKRESLETINGGESDKIKE